MATRIFREKKTTKPSLFSTKLYNIYTDVDNRERARGGDKKQRGRISLKGKHKKREMSGNEKKSEQEFIRLCAQTRKSRKFYVVVVQNNGEKKCTKKVCCTYTLKLFFTN